jgi:hypothetical protein
MLQAEQIATLIERDLSSLDDRQAVDRVRSMLIEPILTQCRWEYVGWDAAKTPSVCPCWTVLTNERTRVAIVFSELGFGPRCPWGLISMDEELPSMGQDNGWFPTFHQAAADVLGLPPAHAMHRE